MLRWAPGPIQSAACSIFCGPYEEEKGTSSNVERIVHESAPVLSYAREQAHEYISLVTVSGNIAVKHVQLGWRVLSALRTVASAEYTVKSLHQLYRCLQGTITPIFTVSSRCSPSENSWTDVTDQAIIGGKLQPCHITAKISIKSWGPRCLCKIPPSRRRKARTPLPWSRD